MAITEVFLTINRMFAQGSEYFVTLDNKEAKIEVTRDNNLNLLMYYIKITLSFMLEESVEGPSKIKEICVSYLNRLIDVVRISTKFYFIERISENDITTFNYITTADNGKQRQGWAMDMSGPFFPLNSIPENDVKGTIDRLLKSGETIPLAEITVLDSYHYFARRQFNIAVILGNIALESIIASHLYDKLVANGQSMDDSKRRISDIFALKKSDGEKGGLHKVLKKDFKEIDGRDFYTGSGLWDKFSNVRTVRKNVIHPSITNLSHDKALQILKDIEEIVKWIKQIEP